MWFVSLLVLIFILGLIILVHEFGHFIWAKIFKVHIAPYLLFGLSNESSGEGTSG